MKSRVTFAPKSHRYTLDGIHVPSVTTILGVLNKGALPAAAARETAAWATIHAPEIETLGADAFQEVAANAYRRVWNERAARGTTVHQIAESLVWGDPMPESDPDGNPWPDDVYSMTQHLARFMDKYQLEPVYAERVVYNGTHKWAGRFDLIADLPGYGRWLLDYKTTASGVWPETAVQLAAYRHATHMQAANPETTADMAMPTVDECGAIHITTEGCELIPVTADETAYRYFGHLAAVLPFTRDRRTDWVGNPLTEKATR